MVRALHHCFLSSYLAVVFPRLGWVKESPSSMSPGPSCLFLRSRKQVSGTATELLKPFISNVKHSINLVSTSSGESVWMEE